jgi:Protein of unknown function (DUF4038)/Putative collagen-binding domain of a collagenase
MTAEAAHCFTRVWSMTRTALFSFFVCTLGIATGTDLRVSDDGRHLVRKQDGQPFFLLADTVWNVTHLLNRDDMQFYLDRRVAQGFNTIFFSGISESGGNEANAYGDKPYLNDDFSKPHTTPGNNPADAQEYDFWDHTEFFIQECARRGLYAALNPIYASWYVRDGHVTLANAERVARFWGERLGHYANVIWVMGGDIRPDFKPEHLEIHRLMARGVTLGANALEDHSKLLMSYHPPGNRTSGQWFHNEPWLDLNMEQTGQADRPGYEMVSEDYGRSPAKPIVDIEPWYEAHPHRIRAGNRLANDFDVRKRAYWAVLAGASGHGYGEASVMLLWRPGDSAFRDTTVVPWKEALDRPGAVQLGHLRRLVESRPMLDRVPDQSLLTDDAMEMNDRIQAARGKDYAMIYSTSGSRIEVHLGRISGEQLRAWWFDPRSGETRDAGMHPNRGKASFQPPSLGLGHDWVLVLDDASKNFPRPGNAKN